MYINLKNGPKVVAVLLLVLLMGACKKKADNGFSIAGKYRVVRYAATDTLVNYYLFNNDKTFTYLHQSDDGSHDVSSGVYQLDEPAVIFSGSIGVALVSKSGDTIKLIKDATKPDSNSDNLILVADAAAPSAADWVTDVSVLTKVPVPDINISSVTFFSSNIWTCYQYEKRLKSYTLTGNEIDVVTTVDEYYGLEGVGGNLWGVKINSDKLVRINPLNGNILFTSAAAPNEMHVITSDGARIYGYNINNSTMFSYSIAGDNFTGTRNFSADIRDMASLGAYLYGSSYNYIYKIDLNTLKIIKTYRVKDVDGVSGIFSDGTSLWIYVNDGLYEPGFFGKLNLN